MLNQLIIKMAEDIGWTTQEEPDRQIINLLTQLHNQIICDIDITLTINSQKTITVAIPKLTRKQLTYDILNPTSLDQLETLLTHQYKINELDNYHYWLESINKKGRDIITTTTMIPQQTINIITSPTLTIEDLQKTFVTIPANNYIINVFIKLTKLAIIELQLTPKNANTLLNFTKMLIYK